VLSLLLTVALAWPRCLVAQQAPVVSALDQSQFPCSPMPVPRITAAVNDRMLTSLNGNVHPLARAEYDQGKVDDSLPLKHIILMLQRSPEQEKALATRIDQMHNRRSSYYHQWLKAEDVGGCYGVADPDIAKVTGWLQSHGFQIDVVPAGKTLVIFSGTAGQVRSTFKTEIHNLNVRGERHIANMSEPQVPTALAPVILGFRSLNNFFPKPLVHVLGPIQRDSGTGKWHALTANKNAAVKEPQPKSNGISPLLTFTGDGETFWAVGPQDFYTIYNETPLLTASRPINGAGQTLAIVQDSDVNPADVTSFRSQFGLPTYPAIPNNTQGGVNFINGISGYCEDPGIVNGGETEADVDVQWLGTSAPAAIIDLVSCADTATTFGGDLSASYIVSTLDTTVSAFSESFGECEAQLPGSGVGSNGFYNGLWEQAVAEGQTPIISAGDSGDDVCDRGNGQGPNGSLGETGLSVNGLASTPYNVAAGGTDFSDSYQTNFSPTNYWNNNDTSPYGSALSYVPEMAWNDTCASTVLVDYVSYVENITYGNGPEGLCNDVNNFGEEFTYLDGGSGGISSIYSLPSWQSVYGVGLNGNFTSTSNRNLPDVSLFAADGFWGHFLVFCQSDVAPCDYSNSTDALSMAAGGTSFVAPQLGGIMGLINQATASRQGQANYTLYALAAQEYGTPGAPNTSTGVPSLYTCEGSNVNAIATYGGVFGNCVFYNVNRTSQFGFTSCVGGSNSGCLVDNNDQPCATGTPDCYTNTGGDAYGFSPIRPAHSRTLSPKVRDIARRRVWAVSMWRIW
jgi:subtilase family serine protease